MNITSSWNVTVKESGNYYVITPLGWNASIPNGGSVEFGACGNGSLGNIDYTLS
jgi:cellulase/cellobiase CelA1